MRFYPASPEQTGVADAQADPRAVALDLMAQSEHGEDSQSLLVCTDPALAAAVQAEIETALPGLSRREIIRAALAHGSVILTEDLDQAFEVVNRYAPEHLIIQMNNAREYIDLIRNAGSVFLGYWTPESVGDYCSGTNHVLPTYGYARNYSGLSVSDFQKRLTFQELSYSGLEGLAPTVETLAGLEGLDAHARAVTVRLKNADGSAAA
jgi:histidinol dehydrogenase